jgi:hypothetical protein
LDASVTLTTADKTILVVRCGRQHTRVGSCPTQQGRDPIILADLLPIAAQIDWRKQRRLWRQLLPT